MIPQLPRTSLGLGHSLSALRDITLLESAFSLALQRLTGAEERVDPFRRLSGIPKVRTMLKGRMGRVRKARGALGQELGCEGVRIIGPTRIRIGNSKTRTWGQNRPYFPV